MSKHILDHAMPEAEGSRVSEYARIDREHAPNAKKAAQREHFRHADDGEGTEQRTREYVRIEREQG